MQPGKTLVGAIMGAILGVALLAAVYFIFSIDKMWMAIPVALLTGLGVRIAVAKSGRVSYLRGAITVLLAMGAYLGGLMITRAVAKHRTETASKPAAQAHMEQPAAGPGEKQPATEPAASPKEPAGPEAVSGHPVGVVRLPGHFSPWDFISLAVAALLAYELGRGTGGVPRPATPTVPGGAVSAGTQPDA
jgi:hypothetical protein